MKAYEFLKLEHPTHSYDSLMQIAPKKSPSVQKPLKDDGCTAFTDASGTHTHCEGNGYYEDDYSWIVTDTLYDETHGGEGLETIESGKGVADVIDSELRWDWDYYDWWTNDGTSFSYLYNQKNNEGEKNTATET